MIVNGAKELMNISKNQNNQNYFARIIQASKRKTWKKKDFFSCKKKLGIAGISTIRFLV